MKAKNNNSNVDKSNTSASPSSSKKRRTEITDAIASHWINKVSNKDITVKDMILPHAIIFLYSVSLICVKLWYKKCLINVIFLYFFF